MLILKRSIHRSTKNSYNVLYHSGSKSRQIVVGMLPGDVLEFREKGRRGRYTIPIDVVFRQAVKRKAFLENMEKGKHRKARSHR